MAKAETLTQRFWTEPFTGRRFHALVDADHPNEITSRDIVAVSTLSVKVPAHVAIWLLSDEGRATVTELLAPAPEDVDLWDGADLIAEDAHLWRLYPYARRPAECRGMGHYVGVPTPRDWICSPGLEVDIPQIRWASS